MSREQPIEVRLVNDGKPLWLGCLQAGCMLLIFFVVFSVIVVVVFSHM